MLIHTEFGRVRYADTLDVWLTPGRGNGDRLENLLAERDSGDLEVCLMGPMLSAPGVHRFLMPADGLTKRFYLVPSEPEAGEEVCLRLVFMARNDPLETVELPRLRTRGQYPYPAQEVRAREFALNLRSTSTHWFCGDYASHLDSVAGLVREHLPDSYSLRQAMYLHDTLRPRTGVSPETLARYFPKNTVDLVRAASGGRGQEALFLDLKKHPRAIGLHLAHQLEEIRGAKGVNLDLSPMREIHSHFRDGLFEMDPTTHGLWDIIQKELGPTL
jgi:hypothetical protein